MLLDVRHQIEPAAIRQTQVGDAEIERPPFEQGARLTQGFRRMAGHPHG